MIIPTKNRMQAHPTQRVNNDIGNAGVGRVIIPTGVIIDEYIEDCYRTNTLTIWGGRGYGLFQGVNVSVQVMQDIRFPESNEENEYGSAVIWIKDENSQMPVIIATLRDQDEFLPLETNQYRLKRCILDKRAIEVFIDAKTASMFVNITGDNEDSGDFNLKVTSENKDSVINVYSDCDINVTSEKNVKIKSADNIQLAIVKEATTQTKITCKVDEGKSSIIQKKIDLVVTDEDGEEQMHASYETENGLLYEDEFDNKVTCADGEVTLNVAEDKAEFKYKKGDGFSYKDEFDNKVVCKNGEIDLTSKKIVEKADTINHNNGGEPMVLGNTLKDLLGQLCSQVSDICTAASTLMVTCGMPGSPSSPPANAAQFISAQSQVNVIKGQLQQILSQKSNLD